MAGPAKTFGPMAEKAKPAVVGAFLNNALGNHFVVVAQDGDPQNLSRDNIRLMFPAGKQDDKVSLGSNKITDVKPGNKPGDFHIDYEDSKGRPGVLTHMPSEGRYEILGKDNRGMEITTPLTRLKTAAEFGGTFPDEKTDKLNRIPVTLAVGLQQAGITHSLKCDTRTEYRAQLTCPAPGAK